MAKCLMKLHKHANIPFILGLHLARRGAHPAFCSTTTQEGSTEHSAKFEDSQSSEDTEHGVKTRILESSLFWVHKHGWTKKALAAGAEAQGLPGAAHGMFPQGGAELVHFFYAKCNRDLSEQLASENRLVEEQQLEKKRTKQFIRDALETRIRMTVPYVDTWPQAMAIMSFPTNAPEAWRNLTNLVDDIWYHAGDRSTDTNWYTKRASLAAVYKSTELFLLQDKSDDNQDTWAFMDRRIGDLTSLGQSVRKCQQSTTVLGELFQSSLEVTRNIIGLQRSR